MNSTYQLINLGNFSNQQTSLDGATMEQEHMTQFERHFYLMNGLVGTLLNFAVLLIAFMHVDTQDKPRQIIVMNMTVADLLTCTIYMLTRSYLGSFPHFLCYPYYVSIVSPQLCSCVNLLWINADKLLFIKRPLHYYTLVNRRRVLVLMVITWISLIGLVTALYSFMNVKNPCVQVELSARIYLLICVLYIATISASFAVSAAIFCIAQNSRRRGGSSKEAKRLFKRLFFVFSSTLWTFVTCLPYRLLYLGILISSSSQSPTPLLRSTVDIAYMLLVIGIVVNPLITIITQRLYRQWISTYGCRFLAFFGLKISKHAATNASQTIGKNRRAMGVDEEGKKGKGQLESIVELEGERSTATGMITKAP